MGGNLPGYDARQVMRRGDFEIAHKQDTYLKDVALHHHDFYEVFCLVSGDVAYTIESRTYHLLPGDLLIISPQELHQVLIRGSMIPYERYVLWIAPSLMESLSVDGVDLCHCFDPGRSGYTNLLHLSGNQRELMQQMMELLWRDAQDPGFGAEVLSHSLLTSILVLVNRTARSAGDTQPEAEQASDLVTRVIDYVNRHYSEPLSLDMLSERFFVSKYHLSHEFNRHMGTGLYQYIQRKRLIMARQLMAKGRKPTAVYEQCGFEDYAGFYRAFRKVYGCSPREFLQSVPQTSGEL